ncbi:MAG: SIS domain-containing protein, partial [bacterium]
VEPGDSTEAYKGKIFDSAIHSLTLVRDRLDPELIQNVVDAIVDASRVFFFGLGASSAVAKDAEQKFFRFGLPVSYHDDILMQRMLASATSPGQLFFIISYTGRTRELVETAELARANGAKLIGLTAPDSPLAKICDLAIEVGISEDTDEYMPMASRIVHLVVLDVLATGVTLIKGEEFIPRLKRIKESLVATRFPSEQ